MTERFNRGLSCGCPLECLFQPDGNSIFPINYEHGEGSMKSLRLFRCDEEDLLFSSCCFSVARRQHSPLGVKSVAGATNEINESDD